MCVQSYPIRILVCDQCGCDIGYPDGFKSRPHFVVTLEIDGQYSDEAQMADLCSASCLAAYGASQILTRET